MPAGSLARLLEAVPVGIYIGSIDAASSTTLAANPCLKRIFGYPADAGDDLVRPFDPMAFVDAAARSRFIGQLEAAGSVADYLLRVRRADGTPFWVEVTAAADRTAPSLEATSAAAALTLHAVVRDVTDRKKHDDQVRDVHHQLAQAEKMVALGQTISGVAHELNNPLATILSWAERLSERQVDDKTRQGLEVILGESERAARIVRNLLTFARKRQTTRAMVDLNDLVRETLELRRDEQRAAAIETREALSDGVPEVFADGHQIKQVLLNLVINAEQAMAAARGGGVLVVGTSLDPERRSAVIEVRDDGPGIAPDVLTRIFDPFFTTKGVGKGTGLGLTVAYAIVQEHGGRIRVSSTPGAGAAFFVDLPVTPDALRAGQPARSAQPLSLDLFKGLRVLVVEDEPALAVAVAEALGDAGFVAERAADGEEGLRCLTESAYDLVICDLKMPKIDGMQFYRAMAAAAPALARRVIFVTGDVAGTDAERFLEETGCRWLSKPFRLGDLLRAARDTLS